ncbi:PTS IIA-like nitrogen-regulatory protein PtsN [Candidatus Electrothrix aarhusensis]|uniref:PTS IIA-like nitrogen-regulatory protein PtsN n=1 Tax=Candidatus Electrothrix aarhusensis TaxID=1859131 RepID=A0A444IRG8_9BACT|nr:PTS IIA-like nitrogen-regulatory protein PtsN [Candidatus Electrothrix aarhusensis]
MIKLTEQCIVLELESTDKEGLLGEMAGAAQKKNPALNSETILEVLLEREQLGSTGVGNGVAIPHGKLHGLEQCMVCFGRSTKGIGFEAKDNKPVHLVVMILSPINMAEEYLQTLARVSKLMNSESKRNKFLQAGNKKTIQQLFNLP